MLVEDFLSAITKNNKEPFFTGVPDSLLKPLCDYLYKKYGISKNHIIAANEGNCTALAAGHYLSTGNIPIVYMQNSGIGNIVNPVVSLLNNKVYGIPCIFIVGLRGEKNTQDEPQHIFQGEITQKLLNDIEISTYIIDENTSTSMIIKQMELFTPMLLRGQSIGFIVKKGSLQFEEKVSFSNDFLIKREEIIQKIVDISGNDIIVCTTGKASRELFEIRENNMQTHKYDFLTVGSMGHCSSIAFGIALSKPHKKIWCIDGDGAIIMHMGAMAVIGANKPTNLIHILINNQSHETVGGQPTVANKMDFVKIAKGCGYENVVSVKDLISLNEELKNAKKLKKLSFIEVKAAIGARDSLGRPTISPKENKEGFMTNLLDRNGD